MKQRRSRYIWSWDASALAVWAVLLLTVTAVYFLHTTLFWIALGLTAAAGVLTLIEYLSRRRLTEEYLSHIARHLKQADPDGLEGIPLPSLAISDTGEILWYNSLFREEVLQEKDLLGENVSLLIGENPMDTLRRFAQFDAKYNERKYSVLHKQVSTPRTSLYVLYFFDNTRLKKIAEEYEKSRPVVLAVYIDNLEELMANARDSERAQLAGRIETLLEDWVSREDGLIRKYQTGRFLVMVEQRHLQRMQEARFPILDIVRNEKIGDVTGITLSLGVGQGEHFRESEEMAQQALEMALGRGGDQAAVRTPDGFDFYGGLSRGVERRTKVRTRVVAAALRERIEKSTEVLLMGHSFSDIDSVGSSIGLLKISRDLGKPAYVVVNQKTTLSEELIARYTESEQNEWIIGESEALARMTEDTLLIVTDTHNPKRLEFPSVYEAAKQVVVIDHHRKMVDYIENAVLFFHEPYASSASEMVTELIQYMDGVSVSRAEAEALLAGIVLDTRSFMMKTGVRTFEASAYLRKQGADTVSVKKMFSGSMELYRLKTDIMSGAQVYRNTIIACTEEGGPEVRVAAAQAANELLSIKGADAAFTLFSDNGGVNISARSYGDFNVQLVMETLGGGGHLAMAGAYLKSTSMEEGLRRLKEAISVRLAEWEQE